MQPTPQRLQSLRIPPLTMVEVANSMPPFCDRRPSPPPPLPLLTSQTPLDYAILHSPPLLVREPVPANWRVRAVNFGFHVPPSRKSSPHPNRRSPYPSTSHPTIRFATPSTLSQQSSDSDVSVPIMKPKGEPGRLQRGGYDLGETLGWKPEELRKLKVNLFSDYILRQFSQSKAEFYQQDC